MFDGVEMPVAILLSIPCPKKEFVTSRVGRIYTSERPDILETTVLTQHKIRIDGYRVAKLNTNIEKQLYGKIASQNSRVVNLAVTQSKHFIYYQEACRYWLKACEGMPFFKRNGNNIAPPHGRVIYLVSAEAASFIFSLLNSSLFYWYYSLFSDCEHVNDQLVKNIPIPQNWSLIPWSDLSNRLSQSLKSHSNRKLIQTKQGHKIEYDEIKATLSKDIIDMIDYALSDCYKFTQNEMDFIINYDIKYRMG